MRRENHLQELQHKAIQAQNGEAVHSGEAEGEEKRERRSCAARRKQTHRQRAGACAREESKKEFESGGLGLHGVPSQP